MRRTVNLCARWVKAFLHLFVHRKYLLFSVLSSEVKGEGKKRKLAECAHLRARGKRTLEKKLQKVGVFWEKVGMFSEIQARDPAGVLVGAFCPLGSCCFAVWRRCAIGGR